MRKDKFGFLIAMLVAFMLCISHSAMAAETVRIGALFPFTGSLALLGNESFNGATIAADMVNDRGGLWSKKIEWVKGDGVDPKKAMTECERLISVEKLRIIFGTYSSSLSYAASEVAERNKVIYWEQGAIADPITARGFKYLFRICTKASRHGIIAADFANEVIAPKLQIDPKKMKVAVVFEDSLYGTTVGSNAANQALKIGMKVVATESYNHKTLDLSPVVMILKARNPDVIIATNYPEDGLLFWRQAKDLDLNVKAFIGTGACHSMPDWARTFGEEGNYIFNSDDPSVGVNPNALTEKIRAIRKEYEVRFNKKFGHPPITNATMGFESARILFEEVLPRAGSLDPEAIRKAALQLDIPKGGTMFGFGLKFAPPEHPDAGQNIRAHSVMDQWQEQKLWVVHPQEFATKKLLLPMPTWEERAKKITRFVD
jgi:branched-chain amino acid transport system substrate-binding protein